MVSKWFHEVWDGDRSAVFTAYTSRVDFGGCEVDYVGANELSEEERYKAIGPYAMLQNLRRRSAPTGKRCARCAMGCRLWRSPTHCRRPGASGKPQPVPLA